MVLCTGVYIINKRKIMLSGLSIVLSVGLMCSCNTSTKEQSKTSQSSLAQSNLAAELIMDIPSAKYFLTEEVSKKDVNKILQAGINTPSARNAQPWHFTVVNDFGVLQRISDDMAVGMPDGGKVEPEITEPVKSKKASLIESPLAIVISGVVGSEFDTGLACQNMSVEANLLGYGTKVISSPTIALNGENQKEYKTILGIPEDQAAVAVLLVGKIDSESSDGVDAITKASTRNPESEMVTYVGE